MEHVVFSPGPDGGPAHRRFPTRQDALAFVEHLRNVEGVTDVTVHELTPVPLSFRAYYKVEVPADEVEPAQVMPAQVMPAEDVTAEHVPAQTGALVAEPAELAPVVAEPVEASANGRRSLGFFAH